VYHVKEGCKLTKISYRFLRPEEGWTPADFNKIAASGSVDTHIFHVSVDNETYEITLGKEVFPCGETPGTPGRRAHNIPIADLSPDPVVRQCSGVVVCRCRLDPNKPDRQQQWNGCRVYVFYRHGDPKPFAASAVVFIRARKSKAQKSDMDNYCPSNPSYLNSDQLARLVQTNR
jgi:hypothetical protein